MSIADIAPGSDQLTDWETKSSKTHQLDSDCSFRTLKLQAQLFITLNPYLTQEIVFTLAHAHTGQLFQKKKMLTNIAIVDKLSVATTHIEDSWSTIITTFTDIANAKCFACGRLTLESVSHIRLIA